MLGKDINSIARQREILDLVQISGAIDLRAMITIKCPVISVY